jgi:hypothetical protein
MDPIVKKCLKSYLVAKKYYNDDIDKSYQYFKQCKILLEQLKKNKKIIDDNILEETEIECNKYISNVILNYIEKPIININTNCENNMLFDMIEEGNIDYLKKLKYGDINFNIYNSQGLTPLHYATKYGDMTFIKHALKLGASIDQTNIYGNTLLEFACLEKDPNMINFLLEYGASMQKHLIFRESKKYFNQGTHIDIILLEKYIMDFELETDYNNYLDWIFKYINKDYKIELELADNNITISKSPILFESFINQLNKLLHTLNDEYRNTYINIIKEELDYKLLFKLGCPTNKIDIILYNLIPFINYNETFQLMWLISHEIKYLIFKIFKNKSEINYKLLKNELLKLIYDIYIKDNIISEGLLQIVILQWISKINI